jgi:arginyl-tRNA--protein-N-Asp/Glu arginylyltransferase
MDYKIRFGPFELLLDGRWQAFMDADAARGAVACTA